MKVVDSKGFHYEVEVDHSPSFGLSTAKYLGRIISVIDSGRICAPSSDDDREHEEYEERVAQMMDQNESDLQPACKQYFDEHKQHE